MWVSWDKSNKNSVEVFSPVKGKWRYINPMKVARAGMKVVVVAMDHG